MRMCMWMTHQNLWTIGPGYKFKNLAQRGHKGLALKGPAHESPGRPSKSSAHKGPRRPNKGPAHKGPAHKRAGRPMRARHTRTQRGS